MAWCAPSARGVPVLSMAGCSARPCCGRQAGEDMIIVQLTCELLCAIPVREVRAAGSTSAPGCSVELFETAASAGCREVARATAPPGLGTVGVPTISRLPLPPGLPDEPSAPPRVGLSGQVPVRDRMARCGKLHRHSLSLSVTLSMDETSRQAFWPSSGSGMTGLLEAP